MNSQDWTDITYLRDGTQVQQKAYRAITELGILSTLKPFDPVIAGTIPIGIDIPGSDLDIICYASAIPAFRKKIRNHFRELPDFREKAGNDRYVANFNYLTFEFEIFAQPIPSKKQLAYQHLVVEGRILRLAPPKFRKEIIILKQNGLKTEPAFAILLGISEPYSGLPELEKYTDEELKNFISERYI